MVRPACFDSNGMKKGAWSTEEDNILRAHIKQFGHPNWQLVPLLSGLARSGKSCRLRWVNYLKPGLKLGKFTKHEEDLIIKFHKQLLNKWSAIAAKLPGRTDSEIKNYWHVHIKCSRKRSRAVTRVVSAETPQLDEQSSEINSCITTDHQESPVSNKEDSPQGLSTDNAENIDARINSVADSYSVAEPYKSQLNIHLPPFLGEELHDFWVCRNDISTFSDSSVSGITCWNSNTPQSQGNFWPEPPKDDALYMVLW